MKNSYEASFIFGRNGRFGLSFSDALKGTELEIFEYGSAEYDEGVKNLVRYLKAKKRLLIIWCLGNGNSANVTRLNRELHLLNELHCQLVRHRVPYTNSLFIYISTGGKMYGINAGQVDENSVNLPVGLYGIQKRECEQLIENKFVQHFFLSSVFRIANAYTLKLDNKKPQGFLDSCLLAVEFGEKIEFVVNPNSRRQYAPHRDYVKAILKVIGHLPESVYGIYNLAPNFTYSLSEIIDIFEAHFRKKIYVEPWEKGNLNYDTVVLDSARLNNKEFSETWQSIELNLKDLI